MLNHRQIEIFRSLMLTQNVTATAEMLFTSQPTISRELARIEKILEYSLFQRKNGKIKATEQAYFLYEEVKRSYIGLEKIFDAAQKIQNNPLGKLEICCQPFLSTDFISNILKIFNQNHPSNPISIVPLESPFIENELSQQHFHLGFLESINAPIATEKVIHFCANEICILPKDHELLSKKTLNFNDFSDQAFIQMGQLDPYRKIIDQLFIQNSIKPQRLIETYNAHSICSLVKADMGISIINPLSAIEHLSDQLCVRPLTFHIPFHLTVVLPSHRAFSQLTQDFLECIHEHLKYIQHKLRMIEIDSQIEIYQS